MNEFVGLFCLMGLVNGKYTFYYSTLIMMSETRIGKRWTGKRLKSSRVGREGKGMNKFWGFEKGTTSSGQGWLASSCGFRCHLSGRHKEREKDRLN